LINENAKKWVAALRSGKYEQGKGYLNIGGTFCCLGVGCEVAIENGLSVVTYLHPDGNNFTVTSYDRRQGFLPERVTEWLGLTTDTGHYDTSDLMKDNDVRHKTFAEIADIIESEPQGLFA
jgi:hypothetical protein